MQRLSRRIAGWLLLGVWLSTSWECVWLPVLKPSTLLHWQS